MLDNWNDSFAKNQLEKYGWQKGEGLGKNKHGNTKHIAVTIKNDTKGIGGNQQQWDFAWWDHLYNKSAKAVAVEKDETDEVKVSLKKKSEDRKSRTGIISTHRPIGTTKNVSTSSMADIAEQHNLMDDVKKAHSSMAQMIARTSLYGGFVKSSKVLVGSESPAAGSESNNTADDDSDNEEKDYSIKVDDRELFAACGGRTARKGGRGLVEQKGKYARVMKEYLYDRKEDEREDAGDKKRKCDDAAGEAKEKKKKKRKEEVAAEDKKEKKKKKEKKDKKVKKEKKKKEKKEKNRH
ncbi:hypothetical protein BX666DRAFT_1409225 [Dichotomocladium elegans]|nr:hypothetical protein BX666DRAFT_1409225 [Dichotomocladium elegans]